MDFRGFRALLINTPDLSYGHCNKEVCNKQIAESAYDSSCKIHVCIYIYIYKCVNEKIAETHGKNIEKTMTII